ncbi:MAG TPA: glycosyltransferase family 9 protein [Gemmatimonadaceae bacterium]|nr:glycosyltransferase family 9 protein [Gemmatimonadaceae bacterium]
MSHPTLDRVAIVMMSAVGDAVHVLPVVNAIKRHRPTCHITWFLEPLPATLVRGHPAVDEVVEVKSRGGLTAWRDVVRSHGDREFDVVLDLQVAIKAGLLTALLNAPVKLGFDFGRSRDANWLFTNARIPRHTPQHVQDQYFEFLDVLGVPHDPVEWAIGPWASEAGWASELIPPNSPPIAAIVVGTSKAEKDWPAERWVPVVDALHQRFNMLPALVGGTSERERAAERLLLERCAHKPLSLLGSGLRKLVTILNVSALVLTPDTAPLHIAVALGKPVISLMGASDPRRTGPYRASRHLLIDAYREPGDPPEPLNIRRANMHRITVEQVLEKIALWNRNPSASP